MFFVTRMNPFWVSFLFFHHNIKRKSLHLFGVCHICEDVALFYWSSVSCFAELCGFFFREKARFCLKVFFFFAAGLVDAAHPGGWTMMSWCDGDVIHFSISFFYWLVSEVQVRSVSVRNLWSGLVLVWFIVVHRSERFYSVWKWTDLQIFWNLLLEFCRSLFFEFCCEISVTIATQSFLCYTKL